MDICMQNWCKLMNISETCSLAASEGWNPGRNHFAVPVFPQSGFWTGNFTESCNVGGRAPGPTTPFQAWVDLKWHRGSLDVTCEYSFQESSFRVVNNSITRFQDSVPHLFWCEGWMMLEMEPSDLIHDCWSLSFSSTSCCERRRWDIPHDPCESSDICWLSTMGAYNCGWFNGLLWGHGSPDVHRLHRLRPQLV